MLRKFGFLLALAGVGFVPIARADTIQLKDKAAVTGKIEGMADPFTPTQWPRDLFQLPNVVTAPGPLRAAHTPNFPALLR